MKLYISEIDNSTRSMWESVSVKTLKAAKRLSTASQIYVGSTAQVGVDYEDTGQILLVAEKRPDSGWYNVHFLAEKL